MSKVVCNISVSADGFSAGNNQTEERPFGEADESILHAWMFATPEENQAELANMTDAKAFIMGRNMFGPIRGDWSRDWKGWWGPEPPFRAPVFVLTHYQREPLVMDGGTTFRFVTGGVEAAMVAATHHPVHPGRRHPHLRWRSTPEAPADLVTRSHAGHPRGLPRRPLTSRRHVGGSTPRVGYVRCSRLHHQAGLPMGAAKATPEDHQRR